MLTSRHPDGHGDSMNESAQWGRFSEKGKVFLLPSLLFRPSGSVTSKAVTFATVSCSPTSPAILELGALNTKLILELGYTNE